MQTHVPSVILLAAAANMDNLIMGVSYGIRKTKISRLSNLIIGLVTALGTALSLALGQSILPVFPERLANIVGGGMIAAIGAAGLLRSFILHTPLEKELRLLTWKESLLLGLALTVNNAAIGIGAGITGMSVLPAAACSLAASLLFLRGGNWVGYRHISPQAGRGAEFLANLLMLCLGLYEILV